MTFLLLCSLTAATNLEEHLRGRQSPPLAYGKGDASADAGDAVAAATAAANAAMGQAPEMMEGDSAETPEMMMAGGDSEMVAEDMEELTAGMDAKPMSAYAKGKLSSSHYGYNPQHHDVTYGLPREVGVCAVSSFYKMYFLFIDTR